MRKPKMIIARPSLAIGLLVASLTAAAGIAEAEDAPAVAANPSAAAHGALKMGMNVFETGYCCCTPLFANILLNCAGFDRGPLTGDGVSMVSGSRCFYDYPVRGMWQQSDDRQETQYQITYACTDPDQDSWRHGHATLVFNGFSVATEPTSDGHGHYTGWLRFNEALMPKGTGVGVTTAYASGICDDKGVCRYPITGLKIRYPGCTDSDFVTPVWKERMGGFTRLRFCDGAGMNGRLYSSSMTVPGSPTPAGPNVLVAINDPVNVQTQQFPGGVGMSWGDGPGKGHPLTFFQGGKWTSFAWGLGCKAPCTLVYRLDRRFCTYIATPAVDHEADGGRPGPHGNVNLSIFTSTSADVSQAEWKLVKSFAHMTTTSGQVDANCDVNGATFLKIQVDDNGDPDGHLDLLNQHIYQITRWQDRLLPSCCCSFNFGWMHNHGPFYGPVFEDIIQECNAMHADLMLNVPITADDDYLRQFARLMLYGSDATGAVYASAQEHPVNPPLDLAHGRRLYLEEDNEVWNWGYNSWLFAHETAGMKGSTDYREYAARSAHMSEIIKAEFAAAGSPDRVKIIFSNNVMGEGTSEDAFAWLSKTNGGKPPTAWFDCYACAPYFGPDNAKLRPGASIDDIFLAGRAGMEDSISWMQQNVDFARKHHLEPTTYEGGLEMTITGDPTHDTRMRNAMASRRAGYILDQYFRAWQDIAGPDAIFNYYSSIDAGRYAGGGQWAILPYLSPELKGSTRYDAVMRACHPAGDCDCDQHVTYADFLTLKRNFGHGHCWAEGDFDNNGDVGMDDYWLLYANLSKADQQRPDVQSFPLEHPGPWIMGPGRDPQGSWSFETWKNAPAHGIDIPAQEFGPETAWRTPFRFSLITPPRHGAIDLADYPHARYTPAPDYIGIDDCVVAVTDAAGVASNPVWIWIDVAPDQLNGEFSRCRPKPSDGQYFSAAAIHHWSATDGVMVSGSRSPLLNSRVNLPDNEAIAVAIQGAGHGIAQDFACDQPGAFTLALLALTRDTCHRATLVVAVDGAALAPMDVSSPSAWVPLITPSFPLTAGAHHVSIVLSGSDAAKPTDGGVAITRVKLAAFTPLSSVAILADPPSPQPAHTPIVLAAKAIGGAALAYQFRIGGEVVQDFSSRALCVWMPGKPGILAITITARDRDGTERTSQPYTYTVAPPVAAIQNGAFRLCLPKHPALGEFAYVPGVSVPGWTIVRGGICGSNGPFLNGILHAPDCDVAAFIQNPGSSIAQTVEFPAAGRFTLSFLAACRNTAERASLVVLLDGTEVTPAPMVVTAQDRWTACVSPAFAVGIGSHQLMIRLGPGSGDISADLTKIELHAVPADAQ